ncbi:MAG: YigZ family protein [Clostridia bacterium]|nr:YigZ family protein [Clostridia bacterium]
MEQSYLTIKEQASAEFVESRSRFIGTIRPVTSEEEALAFIAALKKQYWDAKHNVYAYVLRESRISRSTDDGEPQGTAGMPVLEVLQKQGLTDCVIVVTRYFGGILLGTGGLVRAYSKSASLAVSAAGILRRRLCAVGEVCCDYAGYGRVQPLIAEFGGVVDDTVFTDAVTLKFHLPLEAEVGFQKQLTEISAGKLFFSKKDEKFYDFCEK